MEIDQILERMDDGFRKIQDRLDVIAEDTGKRQLACHSRFALIEQALAVHVSQGILMENGKKAKVDFQNYLMRGAALALVIGMGALLWKLFLGHVDLIVK